MSDRSSAKYASRYNDESFNAKMSRYARAAGKEVVEKALLLYLVLKDPETPAWAKTTIVGALGYFISPIDAIPDLIPGAGFTDDLGVLVLALAAVASMVTPKMRKFARGRVDRWFGPVGPDGKTIEIDAVTIESEPL